MNEIVDFLAINPSTSYDESTQTQPWLTGNDVILLLILIVVIISLIILVSLTKSKN